MGGSLSRACDACSSALIDQNVQQFERFRVKHNVRYGQGAFGATFLAYDLEQDGQRVAAKRVSLHNSPRETLQREVDISRRRPEFYRHAQHQMRAKGIR